MKFNKEIANRNVAADSSLGTENPDHIDIPDDQLMKDTDLKNGEFEYSKYVTIDGIRFIFYIQRSKENADGEAEIHFELEDSLSDPVTNAGLVVFGKIASEIEKMYQEVSKEEYITQFKIIAAKDNHSITEEQRVTKLSQEDLLSLEGFRYFDAESGIGIDIRGQMVSVIQNGNEYRLINLRPQLIDDLEKISGNIPVRWLVPELVRYLKRESGNDRLISEKELQRLKLYQFYFQKRFPKFTFNSKVIKGSDGKRDIEFQKDETGRPYLIVYTHIDSDGGVNH